MLLLTVSFKDVIRTKIVIKRIKHINNKREIASQQARTLPHPGDPEQLAEKSSRLRKLLKKNWERVNDIQDGEILREVQLFSNFPCSRTTCTIRIEILQRWRKRFLQKWSDVYSRDYGPGISLLSSAFPSFAFVCMTTSAWKTGRFAVSIEWVYSIVYTEFWVSFI